MDWAFVLITGFFGSVHCAGMCGAIVAAYTTQDQGTVSGPRSRWRMLARHLSYNAGRAVSYAIVGAALGAAGGTFAGLKMVGSWYSAAVGGLLILSGLWMAGLIPRFGLEPGTTAQERPIFYQLYSRTYGALLKAPTLESKFYIGMLTPLLPCGFLYTAFLMAAASGNALVGAATMAVFAIGIVPALVTVGYISTIITLRLRMWGTKVAAFALIFMGTMMFLRGVGIDLPWMPMGGMQHCH